jgi:hypothetical protein
MMLFLLAEAWPFKPHNQSMNTWASYNGYLIGPIVSTRSFYSRASHDEIKK